MLKNKVKNQSFNDDNFCEETVLVLQGGGSLGAYECGVFKILSKYGLKFDVLTGASIGAINASIICSALNSSQEAPIILENFWLELSENLEFPFEFFPSAQKPYDYYISNDNFRAIIASLYSGFLGNPKIFIPRWFIPDFSYYFPFQWNYIYDIAPLKKTLKKYINTKQLNKYSSNTKDYSRLVINATNVMNGSSVIFDNENADITIEKIVACAGYPFYGIKWAEIDNQFLWDGSLLTNTPMLDIMYSSPKYDKNFYVIDLFPKEQKELPSNLIEVWHRARDIVFMDKTDKHIQLLREIEKYDSLLKKTNVIINDNNSQIGDTTRNKFLEIQSEYNDLIKIRGSMIKSITRIGRKEKMHYLFEDADFSKYRIKKLIREGMEDAERIISERKNLI